MSEHKHSHPSDSFSLISSIWQNYLDHKYTHREKSITITAADAAAMMMLLKITRTRQGDTT